MHPADNAAVETLDSQINSSIGTSRKYLPAGEPVVQTTPSASSTRSFTIIIHSLIHRVLQSHRNRLPDKENVVVFGATVISAGKVVRRLS